MMRRIIASVFVIVAVSLFSTEAMLRAFDPLGIVYFDDLSMFFERGADHPTGYTLPEGVTDYHGWSLTVKDGLRITPDTNAEGPTVRFYGDSVTMCWGANDHECWVNLVADELGLNATNYGRNAYNAWNIAALMDETGRGECSVFLTIGNDLEAPMEYEYMRKGSDSNPYFVRYILDYIYLNHLAKRPAPVEHPSFDPSMREIASDPDTLIVAFERGEYGAMVASRYGAVLIPPYTSRISFADGHANAEGNQQIAEAITPVIAQWLSTRTCQ